MQQKVLVCDTRKSDLRGEIIGYTYEDTSNLIRCFNEQLLAAADYGSIHKFPIGMIRAGECPRYPTVFHALGDGWKLLAPPTRLSAFAYEWWLVRE